MQCFIFFVIVIGISNMVYLLEIKLNYENYPIYSDLE